tara:strand:+ start:478 stop:663 length:186 start_codon:yes stop_codon:yes gene_type:complete
MKLTKEELLEIMQRINAREYELWQVNLAVAAKNTFSAHHPVNILRDISDARRLLIMAGITA